MACKLPTKLDHLFDFNNSNALTIDAYADSTGSPGNRFASMIAHTSRHTNATTADTINEQTQSNKYRILPSAFSKMIQS
jgi:hypothetical protein